MIHDEIVRGLRDWTDEPKDETRLAAA